MSPQSTRPNTIAKLPAGTRQTALVMAKSQEESQAAAADATASALNAIAERVPRISQMAAETAAGAAQTSDTVRELTRMTGGSSWWLSSRSGAYR